MPILEILRQVESEMFDDHHPLAKEPLAMREAYAIGYTMLACVDGYQSEISELAHKQQEPIFITKNGYSDLVVMSAELYERFAQTNKIEQAIFEAEKEVEEGYRNGKKQAEYVTLGSAGSGRGYRNEKKQAEYVTRGSAGRGRGYRNVKKQAEYVTLVSVGRGRGYRNVKKQVEYVTHGSAARGRGYRNEKKQVEYVTLGSAGRGRGYRNEKKRKKSSTLYYMGDDMVNFY